MRDCRYIGLAKTHLQHILTAAAINLGRVFAWLEEIPRARTRSSHFARLADSTDTASAKQSVGLPTVRELEILRDRVLSKLKLGTQASGYKTAQKALNRLIAELIGSV